MAKESNCAIEKKFGVAETLSLAFLYPAPFQKLIENEDKASKSSEKLGFSSTSLDMLVAGLMSSIEPEQQKRVKKAFSIENLKQTNIIIDWDKGRKRILFNNGFIDLIRLTDERLMMELSDVQYKGMLEEAKRLRDRLAAYGDKQSTDAYYELRRAIFIHLSRIRGAIRNNEIKFNSISEKLAELSEGITSDAETFAKAKRGMYTKASTIHKRYILPTVDFLNDSIHVEGGNLFDCFNDMTASFKLRREFESADELTFSLLNLSNAYKPIERISAEVKQFLSMGRDNARAFNAFEKVGALINDELKLTRGMSLRNKDLRKSVKLQDAFDFYRFVDGSKALQPQSPIRFNDTPVFIESMSVELKQLLSMTKQVTELGLVETTSAKSGDIVVSKNTLARAKQLISLANSVELRETDDIYLQLHERLQSVLPYYCFFDLNIAFRGFTAFFDEHEQQDLKIVATGFMKRLEIGDEVFQYKIRKLVKQD